jgi:dihydrofolate reductase
MQAEPRLRPRSRVVAVRKVVTSAAVSLDGYIAGPNETGFEHLFSWFAGGDFEYQSAMPGVSFFLSAPDHRYLSEFNDGMGAFVMGRRMFDLNDGWGGNSPTGKPTIVVTHSVPDDWVVAHPGSPFTFVTGGISDAIERGRLAAGDRNVAVSSGEISSQCLELGLLDEISLELIPVLLGDGVPLFEHLGAAPILLDGPTMIIEGHRVTHLRYTVRR